MFSRTGLGVFHVECGEAGAGVGKPRPYPGLGAVRQVAGVGLGAVRQAFTYPRLK